MRGTSVKGDTRHNCSEKPYSGLLRYPRQVVFSFKCENLFYDGIRVFFINVVVLQFEEILFNAQHFTVDIVVVSL